MAFSSEQVEFLLRPINPARVKHLRGQSHVEGWEIRAHLNRVFGFGNWSLETQAEIVYTEERTDGKWQVGAKAWAKLTIGMNGFPQCSYEDVSADESIHPNRGEAMDNAVKSAATGAFKRCAVNLGDQFGLSLYNDGSVRPLVYTQTPWAVGSEQVQEPHEEPENTQPVPIPDDDQPRTGSGAFE